ncbi:MAG TPA: hypothetical protein VG755_15460 [Nannocystaceae bacterium]|nr:hypothetical protein [Nannocystaceae bacterium]
MKDSFDYPAAHSMDTTWFAIDDEGFVAAFESGEAGAVPNDAFIGDDAYAAVAEIRSKIPLQAFRYVRSGWTAMPAPAHVEARGPGLGNLVMFVDEERDVEALIAVGGRRVEATEGFAVWFARIDTDEHAAIHQRGVCRGCYPEHVDLKSPRISRHGVFEFTHLEENWIAGPYGLECAPEHPARIEDLPKRVRESVVRFHGKFRATPLIQPLEHWPSQAWGAAFLSSDRKRIAAIPGREDDFEDEVAELEGIEDEGVEIVRPDD